MIEQLESRIAPAAVVTFFEADGDKITVKTKLGTTDQLEVVLGIPNGDTGVIFINLDFLASGFAADFAGTDIKITASGNGNKQADSVRIDSFIANDANSFDLGKVKIKGNLLYIDAGDSNLDTPAIKTLDVTSMGLAASGSSASLSQIVGGITTVKIQTDFNGDIVSKNFAGAPNYTSPGGTDIGSFSVGRDIAALRGDNVGHLQVQTIGKLRVKGTFNGPSPFANPNCGLIEAQNIKTINVNEMFGGARIVTG